MARRQFGNDLRLQDQSQEVVAFRLESMLQDLRFAVRQLHKNPGFASTAILVLALGMAASVAIFGFVDAALLGRCRTRTLLGWWLRMRLQTRATSAIFPIHTTRT